MHTIKTNLKNTANIKWIKIVVPSLVAFYRCNQLTAVGHLSRRIWVTQVCFVGLGGWLLFLFLVCLFSKQNHLSDWSTWGEAIARACVSFLSSLQRALPQGARTGECPYRSSHGSVGHLGSHSACQHKPHSLNSLYWFFKGDIWYLHILSFVSLLNWFWTQAGERCATCWTCSQRTQSISF